MNVSEKKRLGDWYAGVYGEGAPDSNQWRLLMQRNEAEPVTIVNFFKMREVVGCAGEASVSGQEAFARYSAVSMPALAAVGGEFLMVSPFEGSFVGEAEDWDLIAIGRYPCANAVFELFADEDYKKAYEHRVAACAKQRVMFAGS